MTWRMISLMTSSGWSWKLAIVMKCSSEPGDCQGCRCKVGND